jgi:hypothetical protein
MLIVLLVALLVYLLVALVTGELPSISTYDGREGKLQLQKKEKE